MLIVAYIFLLIAIAIFGYYVAGYFLKKWEARQQQQADAASAQLENMFLFINPKALLTFMPIFAIGLGILGYIIGKKWWVALVFLVAGLVLPAWFRNRLDRSRRKKFVLQLVDGLMIMNSCLKGGLTLTQSFEVLAEETSPPISQEITLFNREIKVGVTLEEALLRLEKRMPSEEMTLVLSAVLVARETGGDLTKVFSRLVETIRDRIKLRELVTTLTLQAKLQSIIISALGPVFFIVIRKIRPDHFDIMWQDPMGRTFLFIAVVLQIIGIILIIIFGRIEI